MSLTQSNRILRALERAGDRGITAVDFMRLPTIDGGPPITRVAARVDELRKRGVNIRVAPERRDSCVVYQVDMTESRALVESVLGAASQRVEESRLRSAERAARLDTGEQDPLFDGIEVGRGQRSAIYGSEEAA